MRLGLYCIFLAVFAFTVIADEEPIHIPLHTHTNTLEGKHSFTAFYDARKLQTFTGLKAIIRLNDKEVGNAAVDGSGEGEFVLEDIPAGSYQVHLEITNEAGIVKGTAKSKFNIQKWVAPPNAPMHVSHHAVHENDFEEERREMMANRLGRGPSPHAKNRMDKMMKDHRRPDHLDHIRNRGFQDRDFMKDLPDHVRERLDKITAEREMHQKWEPSNNDWNAPHDEQIADAHKRMREQMEESRRMHEEAMRKHNEMMENMRKQQAEHMQMMDEQMRSIRQEQDAK